MYQLGIQVFQFKEKSPTTKFAVAHVNLFDGNLKVECVEAPDWRSALLSHTSLQAHTDDPEYKEWLYAAPSTVEEVWDYFSNTDVLVDVIEILDSA